MLFPVDSSLGVVPPSHLSVRCPRRRFYLFICRSSPGRSSLDENRYARVKTEMSLWAISRRRSIRRDVRLATTADMPSSKRQCLVSYQSDIEHADFEQREPGTRGASGIRKGRASARFMPHAPRSSVLPVRLLNNDGEDVMAPSGHADRHCFASASDPKADLVRARPRQFMNVRALTQVNAVMARGH